MDKNKFEQENDVKSKGLQNFVSGEYPANLLNELIKFLGLKDMFALCRARKGLYQEIFSNSDALTRMKIARTRFNDEMCYALYQIAQAYCRECLNDDDIKGFTGKNDKNDEGNRIVMDALKELGGKNIDIFMTSLIANKMFFDVFTNLDGIYPDMKKPCSMSIDLLKKFLNSDSNNVRKEIKNFLQQEFEGYRAHRVFDVCLKKYFEQVIEKLDNKLDKDLRTKILCEFLKFWLWQLHYLDEQIKDTKDEDREDCFKEIRNNDQILSEFIYPSKYFSTQKFIYGLSASELKKFLFDWDNKYHFLDSYWRFSKDIYEDINYVFAKLVKNKDSMGLTQTINSELKKLLQRLILYPELIDDLEFITDDQTENSPNDIKVVMKNSVIGFGPVSLHTFKSKFKVVDHAYTMFQVAFPSIIYEAIFDFAESSGILTGMEMYAVAVKEAIEASSKDFSEYKKQTYIPERKTVKRMIFDELSTIIENKEKMSLKKFLVKSSYISCMYVDQKFKEYNKDAVKNAFIKIFKESPDYKQYCALSDCKAQKDEEDYKNVFDDPKTKSVPEQESQNDIFI